MGYFGKKNDGGASTPLMLIAVFMGVIVLGGGLLLLGVVSLPGAVNVPNDMAIVPLGAPAVACGASLFGQPQVPGFAAFDKDAVGTLLAPTNTKNFEDPKTGTLHNDNLSKTTPGEVYTVWSTQANYIGGITTYRTPCEMVNPSVSVLLKAYDTAPTISVVNSNALTTNAIGANAQALGLNDQKNLYFDLTPSTKNKYIGGAGADTGGTGVAGYWAWINVSTNATVNASDYNTGQWSLSSITGANCNPASYSTAPSGSNTILRLYNCDGDFDGQDMSQKRMTLSVATVANVDAVTMNLCFAPRDYYQQVYAQDGKPKGSLQIGAFKDDGSAIETAKCTAFYLQ